MIKRILFVFLVVTSCSPKNKEHKPVDDNSPTLAPEEIVDYSQVKPIFAQHCAKCHPSRSAPDWLDYDQALPYIKSGELHRRVVIEKSMPPASDAEAALVTDADRQLIAKWIASGAPEKASDVKSSSPNGSAPIEETLDHPEYVSACLGCHGKQDPQTYLSTDIPKISGQNRKYLWHQLMNFKWYDRIDPSFQMNQQTASLSDEMIEKIADYFSNVSNAPEFNQTPPLNAAEQVLYNRGERIAQVACVQCHRARQEDYSQGQDIIPILNGQSRNYLRSQILSYQKGLRHNNLMESIVAGFTHEDIESIAIYFSHIGEKSNTP